MPNNGILFDGVFRLKLFHIPFTSCFLIYFDFLLPHIAHSDNIIVLPLLVFETLGFILSVLFYTLNNKMTLFCICNLKPLLINFFFFNNFIDAYFLTFFNQINFLSITFLTFHYSNAFC